MNATASTHWKWGRWLWAFPLGVALHAGLVFWLGDRPRPKAPPKAPGTRILLAVDDEVAKKIAARSGASDPILFAMPNGRGFSGEAWLRFAPDNLAAPGWSEPPSWLALRTGDLGRTFAEFVATNQPALPPTDRRPSSGVLDIYLPAETAGTQSTVRIEGALARRPLVTPLPLPAPAHPDALPGTVVQLAVNAEGHTESAMLLTECGVKTIDQQALELARNARFKPVPAPGLTWGKMYFDWRTVPPVTTNAINGRVE